jgi:hypothetical protein
MIPLKSLDGSGVNPTELALMIGILIEEPEDKKECLHL